MKKMLKRVAYVTKGEDGASNVEIVVWISVVLVIASILFIFRDTIRNFLNRASGTVNSLQVS